MLPVIEDKVVGICHISTSAWLRNTEAEKIIQKKFYLFSEEMLKEPFFLFPHRNEEKLLK